MAGTEKIRLRRTLPPVRNDFAYRRIHQIAIGAVAVEALFIVKEIVDPLTVILDGFNNPQFQHWLEVI